MPVNGVQLRELQRSYANNQMTRGGAYSGFFSPVDEVLEESRTQLDLTNFEHNPYESSADGLDVLWGSQNGSREPDAANFDYFYTGSDVQILIDGLDVLDMPMCVQSFAFRIEQQKTPIYGFWDYTYREVMKGNRIVNGAFSIATKYPNYMTKLLSTVAEHRASNPGTLPRIRGLTEDEENIERYWSRNRINDNLDMAYEGKHLFSSHPPFNFVIMYNVQPVSLTSGPNGAKTEELIDHYADERASFNNMNDRIVPADSVSPNKNMRRVIENVELVNMATEYDNSGQVCVETYSFFARDVYNPSS